MEDLIKIVTCRIKKPKRPRKFILTADSKPVLVFTTNKPYNKP